LTHQNNIKSHVKRPHFNNLDALRFLAAFSVLLFHFFSDLKSFIPNIEHNTLYKGITLFTSKGLLGVNFFFVLSGFLITYLILFEVKHQHSFNLKHFLIRRTLRIWPLYFIIFCIGFFLSPLLFSDYDTKHHAVNYLFFLANFDEIWHGANDSINFLTSPWSVAVEEQFYLIWGILLLGLSKLKKFNLITLIVILLSISFVFRFMNYDDFRIIYYHTLSVMPDILIGALLAHFYLKKSDWLVKLKSLSKLKIIIIYLIGFSLILLKNKIFTGQLIIIERYVFALFFAFILLEQFYFKHSFFKLGRLKVFNHLGKVSYGLYMYHLVVLFALQKLMINLTNEFNINHYIIIITYFTLGILGTYALSLFSYHVIEKPFLTLKKRFN
jgi:peptidoglycan/LPS O-acetylase OafA/YrhL